MSTGMRQHVGVLDPERGAFPRGRHDRGGRAALEQPLGAQHDVVDVDALPEAADGRSGVAAAVAGVEHHRDPVEIEGQQLVLDLLGGGTLRFPLPALRMIGRQIAGREQVERDLDLVADGEVAHVADRVALSDLVDQFVHVGGEEPAGESHHDAGVEGFAGLQPVAGVVALRVGAIADEGPIARE